MMIAEKTYQTRAVAQLCQEDPSFNDEIFSFYERYCHCDWGDLCKEDRLMNDEALENGERIVAAYESSRGKIYIITEYGHQSTTILFASEY